MIARGSAPGVWARTARSVVDIDRWYTVGVTEIESLLQKIGRVMLAQRDLQSEIAISLAATVDELRAIRALLAETEPAPPTVPQ